MYSCGDEMQQMLYIVVARIINITILKNVRSVATHDRVIPYYAPNSSIKHSKSDSKDRSQEIL
jgi:hypothetical protein